MVKTYRPPKEGSELELYIDWLISRSGVGCSWLWKDNRFDDPLEYSAGLCYVNQGYIALSKKYCENNFDYRPEYIKELVSHELAHFRYPNHSKEFKHHQVMILSKFF